MRNADLAQDLHADECHLQWEWVLHNRSKVSHRFPQKCLTGERQIGLCIKSLLIWHAIPEKLGCNAGKARITPSLWYKKPQKCRTTIHNSYRLCIVRTFFVTQSNLSIIHEPFLIRNPICVSSMSVNVYCLTHCAFGQIRTAVPLIKSQE